ncbi:MAG: ATP-binding protein, partial [Oscillospiraceae bacterium]|nr:ATP-binding protein [Oscillospiraceae bacterium]
NSIMGFAELALDSLEMAQIKSYLEKISDSSSWLLCIINDILDISKIESGKMELEHAPFNLHEVFSRCQSVILPIVKEKNLDLRVYLERIDGKKILGDPVRLYQILMNLLSNASKFTETGAIYFSSTVRNTDNGTAEIYFEVKDTGIGMTDEQISRIFEPFTQADAGTTRNYGGTGLGLAITKNIVELMGGKLSVESTLGTGSKFSFVIAFDTIESEDDLTIRDDSLLLEKPHFNAEVLICDDNSMNLEVICEHLSRVGVKAVLAENGKLGVETVEKRKQSGAKPFDLIFMDMFMPVMDGMEAAAKIAALETGSPIIAMTANIMTSEIEKYKKSGMPDCLGKPFTSQELWRILLKHLTPISSSNAGIEYDENDEFQKKLRFKFVKNNQNIHDDISEAAAAGDYKVAHRLAHTLKGSAGLIGMNGLRNAAEEVEILLKGGTAAIWDNKMNALKDELDRCFEALQPLVEELENADRNIVPLTAEETLQLFAELEPMLENLSPDCVNYIPRIKAVPGGAELAQQVEDYDFKGAIKSLEQLRKGR